jgi:hypothetical protein
MRLEKVSKGRALVSVGSVLKLPANLAEYVVDEHPTSIVRSWMSSMMASVKQVAPASEKLS